MQLSEQQVSYFRTFGFLIFRQVLTPAEVEQFSGEFDRGLAARLGRPHDGEKRVWATLMDDDTPFIASLVDDPRFADVAEQLLDKPTLGIGTDGNYYTGDTLWHTDFGVPAVQALRFTFYLDPLTAGTGALRVVPGSHREPLHSALGKDPPKDPAALFGVPPDAVPAYACESNPGDALVFDSMCWHAAFGGSRHRRMALINYFEDPRSAESAALVRNVLHGKQRFHATLWGRPFYPESWRAKADPRHQRWVSRLRELGVLDPPPVPG